MGIKELANKKGYDTFINYGANRHLLIYPDKGTETYSNLKDLESRIKFLPTRKR
jgi:hypothetical protein